jgi:hypothetical protein
MSQDAESQEIANIREADFLPSSWTSQPTSLKKLNCQHSAGLLVMGTSLNNWYFANHSQKQQKSKTFLMLLIVISVLTICHGNHASAWYSLYVGKPEMIRSTGQAKELWNCFHILFPPQRWYACQPSDLGQGTLSDITKHIFLTFILMLS